MLFDIKSTSKFWTLNEFLPLHTFVTPSIHHLENFVHWVVDIFKCLQISCYIHSNSSFVNITIDPIRTVLKYWEIKFIVVGKSFPKLFFPFNLKFFFFVFFFLFKSVYCDGDLAPRQTWGEHKSRRRHGWQFACSGTASLASTRQGRRTGRPP